MVCKAMTKCVIWCCKYSTVYNTSIYMGKEEIYGQIQCWTEIDTVIIYIQIIAIRL